VQQKRRSNSPSANSLKTKKRVEVGAWLLWTRSKPSRSSAGSRHLLNALGTEEKLSSVFSRVCLATITPKWENVAIKPAERLFLPFRKNSISGKLAQKAWLSGPITPGKNYRRETGLIIRYQKNQLFPSWI